MYPNVVSLAEASSSEHLLALAEVDSLTFQPCSPHVYQNQDRFVVEEWNFPGGTWQFNSIFDGEYSQILRDSIVQLDESISSNFLDLFPRDLRRLSQISDEQVQNIFQRDSTGRSNRAAARCLGGTTLVLSLTDPHEKNVWVANLGVLGLRHHSGAWTGTLRSGYEPKHPREPDSVKHGRVLGFLEPTRAIGDIWLKIPSLYTSRLDISRKLRQCASRISTPPYVSSVPDIYHRDLPSRPWFLILCSDGLPSAETYNGMDPSTTTRIWTDLVGRIIDSQPPCSAIGGQDEHKVSRNLTVEMEERWMDDVSISIQLLSAPPRSRSSSYAERWSLSTLADVSSGFFSLGLS
ncbi:protein serine/threonine phosphatase 2C [Mycena olivaceomarginata]|nr:protein serine/threonine phosphatase 2C [Mycena olivaceomarginata]